MDLSKRDKIEISNLYFEQLHDMEDDMDLNNVDDILYGRVLSEKDFYPPVDDRTLRSGVEDIDDGDNFAEFLHEFFELCDEEEVYN